VIEETDKEGAPMTLRLGGSIPANILPLDADHRVDEDDYRRHIAWLAATRGVGGITCNGHAAEVSTLSRGQRRRLVALTVEAVRSRVPVIAGVYAENHVQAIELARDAQAEGADALLVFPLNAQVFGVAPEVPYAHFARIADAVPLPLVAFVYPSWTGMQLSTETLVRICEEIPAVVAVKEWSLDLATYERNAGALRSLGRHVALLSSFSTNLLPTLVVDADGILSGHGSVIADLHAELLDLVGRGRLDAARDLYRRIQVLTAVVYRQPFADMYTRMKEQLVMLGRLRRAVSNPPLLPLAEEERARLRRALVDARLLEPAGAATG
jgi:4-hydroxy-tetrahydrodipicolinate synthase